VKLDNKTARKQLVTPNRAHSNMHVTFIVLCTFEQLTYRAALLADRAVLMTDRPIAHQSVDCATIG